MSQDENEGLFSDLEEMAHHEVSDLSKEIGRQLRSLEKQHEALRFERKSQIDLVKSMRSALDDMQEMNSERRALLNRFHKSKQSADKARNARDQVNRAIPPPTSLLGEWLAESYQKLVTIDNDLTVVPSLNREMAIFRRFFELQAAYVRKVESEAHHSEYIKHLENIRSITKELDATRPKKKEGDDGEEGKDEEKSNISRKEVRKTSKTISKIDKQLDVLSEERKSLRKELKRIQSYLRITSSRGKPIKISEVRDRAQSGGALNATELGALLNSGGLGSLGQKSEKKPEKQEKISGRGKKPRRRLGVARGGARKGTRAARRDE